MFTLKIIIVLLHLLKTCSVYLFFEFIHIYKHCTLKFRHFMLVEWKFLYFIATNAIHLIYTWKRLNFLLAHCHVRFFMNLKEMEKMFSSKFLPKVKHLLSRTDIHTQPQVEQLFACYKQCLQTDYKQVAFTHIDHIWSGA